MGDYKFDTFYYSKDKSNEHHLSEIEDLSDEKFDFLYRGKIYCPECKGPQLSRVKKEGTNFLRAYPNQPHLLVEGEKCFYECDTASKKVMEEHIKKLRSKRKIKSLLEAIMRKLFRQDIEPRVLSKDDGEKFMNPLLIERVKSDGTIKKNVIPHYSFRSWGKNIPQEQLLVVYGKMYIELKEARKSDNNEDAIRQIYIHFKNIHTKELITSCLKPQTLEIANGNYYVVALGKCQKREFKGTTYYNLKINFPVDESILLKAY